MSSFWNCRICALCFEGLRGLTLLYLLFRIEATGGREWDDGLLRGSRGGRRPRGRDFRVPLWLGMMPSYEMQADSDKADRLQVIVEADQGEGKAYVFLRRCRETGTG